MWNLLEILWCCFQVFYELFVYWTLLRNHIPTRSDGCSLRKHLIKQMTRVIAITQPNLGLFDKNDIKGNR